MTLTSIYTLLAGTNIPVSYSSVPMDEATAKPYICYSEDSRNNFAADGIVFYSQKVISVKLYTETRDETTEAKVETALKDVFWTKAVDFLDDQKIYEITYEIEV